MENDNFLIDFNLIICDLLKLNSLFKYQNSSRQILYKILQ